MSTGQEEYNTVKVRVSVLRDEKYVIIACPLGATFLLPVEIIEPLGTALLLRPCAHVLRDLRPRESAGNALT